MYTVRSNSSDQLASMRRLVMRKLVSKISFFSYMAVMATRVILCLDDLCTLWPKSAYIPAGTQRWNNVESTLIQRWINVEKKLNQRWIDVVSTECAVQRQDVESTLFQRCVPAGMLVHPGYIVRIRSFARTYVYLWCSYTMLGMLDKIRMSVSLNLILILPRT